MSVNSLVYDNEGDEISVSYDDVEGTEIFLHVEFEDDDCPDLTGVTALLDGPSAQALGIALIRAAYELDCL